MSETEVENGEYTICHRGRTGLLSTFVPAVHDLGERKKIGWQLLKINWKNGREVTHCIQGLL